MRLLLASKSPRRRQLLGELGYEVEYVSMEVDEHVDPSVHAAQVAETVARRKADAFPQDNLQPTDVLITADTVVVYGDQALGKPADRQQAIDMLCMLSGQKHTVYTGVCLRTVEQTTSFTEATDVFFRRLSMRDIEYYVDNYRPYDKAGAYGIQEWIGMVGIEKIEGCYYNVMGLPVARLYEALSRISLSR